MILPENPCDVYKNTFRTMTNTAMNLKAVHIVYFFLLFVTLLPFLNAGDTTTNTKKTSMKPPSTTTVSNRTENVTKPANTNEKSIITTLTENKGMLMRALYVLIGVTSVVILYFVVRAWRLRRRRNKSKKYGLITGRGADYEMAPLDQDDDDDDEDMTVFEMNNKRKK